MQAIYSYALLEENFLMLKPDANSVIQIVLRRRMQTKYDGTCKMRGFNLNAVLSRTILLTPTFIFFTRKTVHCQRLKNLEIGDLNSHGIVFSA